MIDELEILALLFVDSVVGNLVVTSSSEIAIYALVIFGNLESYKILSFASCGYLVAALLNYYLGKVSGAILSPMVDLASAGDATGRGAADGFRPKIKLFDVVTNPAKVALLLLPSCIPFWGNFVVFFAGMYKFPLLPTLTTTLAVKFFYYLGLVLLH